MMMTTSCPTPLQLKALLDSQLPETDQAELVRHLDTCEGCQHSLQDLAVDGTTWAATGLRPEVEQPPSCSAFWPAVRRLEQEVALTPPNDNAATVVADATPVLSPTAAPELSLDFLSPPEHPGTLGRLERFHVLRVIGRGGMGMVLEALDQCLQRKVAIKVMDPKYARDETARARFCREARAAAAVTHDNVVAIHQVDRLEEMDLPYLVMQYIPGESLDDLLNRQGALPLADVVRIGMQAAQGLAAAHAQGLVHRDVKPANILLEEGGQKVRLSDFGLARATEDVKLTQTGFVAGTPLYMSPEQARGETLDHRTDLFSLGSVLYAMCTGQPPFDGSTPYAVLRRVTDEEPPPIEKVNPNIPEWLIALIDRLHAKKPAERFQTAAEVAALLAEHLVLLQTVAPQTQPVVGTGRIRFRRGAVPWWRAALPGVAAFVLLQGTLLLTDALGLTHLYTWRSADAPGPAAQATLPGSAGPIWSAAFSPDGHTLAMAIDNGTIKLWNLPDDKVRATLYAHQGPIWRVTYSPDGSRLATAGDDSQVKVWDTTTDKEIRSFKHPAGVRTVAFAPDGKRLVTGDRQGHLHLWPVDGTTEDGTKEDGIKELATTLKGHRGAIAAVVFSPDGKTVASAGGDNTIKLWNAADLKPQLTMSSHTGGVYTLAFAPDGKTLASGGWDRKVRLWDVGTGDQLAEFEGHTADVWSVAFSPDGRLLASGSEDRTVKVWDVAARREVAAFKRHTGTVYTVRFAPNGQTLASGSRDGTVKLWDVSRLAGGR